MFICVCHSYSGLMWVFWMLRAQRWTPPWMCVSQTHHCHTCSSPHPPIRSSGLTHIQDNCSDRWKTEGKTLSENIKYQISESIFMYLQVSEMHKHQCVSLAVSEDGRYLLTAGQNSLKVWDYDMHLDVNSQVCLLECWIWWRSDEWDQECVRFSSRCSLVTQRPSGRWGSHLIRWAWSLWAMPSSSGISWHLHRKLHTASKTSIMFSIILYMVLIKVLFWSHL